MYTRTSIIVAIFYPFSQFCEINIFLLSLQTQPNTAPNIFQRGVEYGKYEVPTGLTAFCSLNSSHVQTLRSTDVHTPFLGTPLVSRYILISYYMILFYMIMHYTLQFYNLFYMLCYYYFTIVLHYINNAYIIGSSNRSRYIHVRL